MTNGNLVYKPVKFESADVQSVQNIIATDPNLTFSSVVRRALKEYLTRRKEVSDVRSDKDTSTQ